MKRRFGLLRRVYNHFWSGLVRQGILERPQLLPQLRDLGILGSEGLVHLLDQPLDRRQRDAVGVDGADRLAVAETEQALEVLGNRTDVPGARILDLVAPALHGKVRHLVQHRQGIDCLECGLQAARRGVGPHPADGQPGAARVVDREQGVGVLNADTVASQHQQVARGAGGEHEGRGAASHVSELEDAEGAVEEVPTTDTVEEAEADRSGTRAM